MYVRRAFGARLLRHDGPLEVRQRVLLSSQRGHTIPPAWLSGQGLAETTVCRCAGGGFSGCATAGARRVPAAGKGRTWRSATGDAGWSGFSIGPGRRPGRVSAATGSLWRSGRRWVPVAPRPGARRARPRWRIPALFRYRLVLRPPLARLRGGLRVRAGRACRPQQAGRAPRAARSERGGRLRFLLPRRTSDVAR